jgi:amidophosphoribosyltransferase
MGVDMAKQEELIAGRMTVDEIAIHIGVDSLGYLSLEALRDIVAPAGNGHCEACFCGDYPVAVKDEGGRSMFQ